MRRRLQQFFHGGRVHPLQGCQKGLGVVCRGSRVAVPCACYCISRPPLRPDWGRRASSVGRALALRPFPFGCFGHIFLVVLLLIFSQRPPTIAVVLPQFAGRLPKVGWRISTKRTMGKASCFPTTLRSHFSRGRYCMWARFGLHPLTPAATPIWYLTVIFLLLPWSVATRPQLLLTPCLWEGYFITKQIHMCCQKSGQLT